MKRFKNLKISMGSKSEKSQFMTNELETWKAKHTIELNGKPEPSDTQKEKLEYFMDQYETLGLFYSKDADHIPRFLRKRDYQHWFVSNIQNQTCTVNLNIEFVPPKILQPDEKGHQYQVLITEDDDRTYKEDVVKVKEFKCTADVKERIKEVLGATNFSLLLRNSEHVARYIHCGTWVSMQCSGASVIRTLFKKQLKDEMIIRRINIPPSGLSVRNAKADGTKIFSDNEYDFNVEFTKQVQYLHPEDDNLYNIVFFGPTGAGKSSLINLLFNSRVTLATSGAMSVTKDIIFSKGKAKGMYLKSQDGKMEKVTKDVNIVDTVGFCDTKLSPWEIYELVKDKLSTNLLHIDRVVFVSSGRLEKAHKEAIKQFMDWLKYEKNKKNFCFIHNKCDAMDEGQRLQNLQTICEELAIDNSITNEKIEQDTNLPTPVQMVNALGFHPKADFEDIREDIQLLQDCIINCPAYSNSCKDLTPKLQRIKVHKPDDSGMCTIL